MISRQKDKEMYDLKHELDIRSDQAGECRESDGQAEGREQGTSDEDRTAGNRD